MADKSFMNRGRISRGSWEERMREILAQCDDADIGKCAWLSGEIAHLRRGMNIRGDNSEEQEKLFFHTMSYFCDRASQALDELKIEDPNQYRSVRHIVENLGAAVMSNKKYHREAEHHHQEKIDAFLKKSEPILAGVLENMLTTMDPHQRWTNKSFALLMNAYAQLRWKPTLLENHWLALIKQDNTPEAEPRNIASLIYAMGVLKIKPDSELIEKYMQALGRVKEWDDYALTNTLYGLAMISANGVDIWGEDPNSKYVIGKLFSTLDQTLLSANEMNKDERKSITHQAFLASQYFRTNKDYHYETPQRDVMSAMQRLFLGELKRAARRFREQHPDSTFHCVVESERPLPSTRTPIDYVVRFKGHRTKSALWVQLDGVNHYLRCIDGTEMLRGQDELKDAIVEKNFSTRQQLIRISHKEVYPEEFKDGIAAEDLHKMPAVADRVISSAYELYQSRTTKNPNESRYR